MEPLDFLGVQSNMLEIRSTTAAYFGVTLACILPALFLASSYLQHVHCQREEPEGCQLLGSGRRSNLRDEHRKQYAGPKGSSQNTTWRVKSLWIYPIKSCTGVELDAGEITGSGMEHDRRFCFAQLNSKFPQGVDELREEKPKHRWEFITQRRFPAMAMIKTEVWLPDPSSSTYSSEHPNIKSGGVLVIKFPLASDMGVWGKIWRVLSSFGAKRERTIHMPFRPSSGQIKKHGYTMEDLEIWKDKPSSLLVASTERGDSWIQELRYFLGITNHLALFRVSTDESREVYRCAPRKEEVGYQPTVGFQDAYPLHILNLASVHDVAKNMAKGAPQIGARNFRPNIVITGGDAYAEDSWKRVEIGGFEYYVSCRTVRCLLPNVNPTTGIRHENEPNRTLKSFRRIDEGDPNNACLGMQMVPALENSRIKVGDTVTILETGAHFYLKQ